VATFKGHFTVVPKLGIDIEKLLPASALQHPLSHPVRDPEMSGSATLSGFEMILASSAFSVPVPD
jgi:hypothetical protein